MEFEDVLLEVGDYGRFQKHLLMIFLVPAVALLPWFSMNVIFMMSVPDHWCNVPELIHTNLTLSQQRALISPPKEHCMMYNISYDGIGSLGSYEVPNGTDLIPCNRGWQYDTTDYEFNAATQFNLVCSDEHYNSFVLSMYNVGSIIGTPIYGALADRIGRKITFFITIIVTAVTGIGSVLMTDFTAFVVVKTINGSLMPSVFQLPFIIVLEIVAPEVRTKMNGIVNIGWTVGACALPLLAFYSRNWIVLGIVTSAVTLIFLFYYRYLPESPRWLISQERYEEAGEIMYHIGKKNDKSIEKKDVITKLQKLGEKFTKERTEEGVENSTLDLLRYPELRKKFIIITVCWMSNIMSYYGLQINVTNLAGNEFLNFFLLTIAEIPGYLICWALMERLGRRWVSAGGFFFTGVVCMMSAIEFPHGDVIFSMIGKFFAAATFMATYQQSSELYPTVIRSLAMGMSSTVSMVITLVVPYVVYLNIYGKAIPFIVIGACSIVAAIAAAFLPETLNENLPQTIFDAEQFGKKQKFFAMNRRRLSMSRERAASIVAKRKSLEAYGNDPKNPGSYLENIQYVSDMKNSTETAELPQNLNSGNQKKNNVTDNTLREINAMENIPKTTAALDRRSEGQNREIDPEVSIVKNQNTSPTDNEESLKTRV